MLDYNKISSFIWKINDDVLRGLFKEHEYGDIILPFIVLRRMDCVLESDKEEVYKLYQDYKNKVEDPSPIIQNKIKKSFYNHSKYDLKGLLNDPNNINKNFINYLNGYSTNVFELIKNFEIEKPIERLQDENLFYKFIQEMVKIDLSPSSIDNRMMGIIYEELIRISCEKSNQKSGEHFTPRDIVELLVSILFSPDKEKLKGKGLIRGLFDPCCGTGGMLTMGSRWIKNNINPDIGLRLCGQELNPQTSSICKSDFLISGFDPNNIRKGSSLSNDKFENDKFEYLITNPPFGESWKTDKKEVLEENNPYGRFNVGIPRIDDGSFLFLQHMISKMDKKGSRLGIIFNGSPLFSGDSGSGESNIRKWILEQDLLESIIQLPKQMFFRTDIYTYLWILSNKKTQERVGKTQLINGESFFVNMKKSLGKKRKMLSEKNIHEILNLYLDFKENKYSKIYPNDYFGYTRVVVEQPLLDGNGNIIFDKKGKPKPDSKKRDYERIPLNEDIDEYFNKEVKPYSPDSWMDRSRDSIGYEFNFNKYFFEYESNRSLKDIISDIQEIENEIDFLKKDINDK